MDKRCAYSSPQYEHEQLNRPGACRQQKTAETAIKLKGQKRICSESTQSPTESGSREGHPAREPVSDDILISADAAHRGADTQADGDFLFAGVWALLPFAELNDHGGNIVLPPGLVGHFNEGLARRARR